MAQQAATANAMCSGRFRLGLGPSHALAERIDEYYAAGADEVIVSPKGTIDAQRDGCLRVLADIAKG